MEVLGVPLEPFLPSGEYVKESNALPSPVEGRPADSFPDKIN